MSKECAIETEGMKKNGMFVVWVKLEWKGDGLGGGGKKEKDGNFL